MTTSNATANPTSTSTSASTWTGMIPVEDTALAVTDTRGPGRPVIYLNGSYATRSTWRPVIAELGNGWRHITFDERARGRSKRSSDYSFEACLRDIDAVIEATGAQRPVLVGWSYGAALALHYAARNSDRLAGVVMVDGGYPWDYLATVDGDGREEIRRMFRKFRWLMPLTRRLGLSARMSADQHADINIELNEIVAASDPAFDLVTCPMRFIVASGRSLGGTEEGHAAMRATLDPVLERNPHVQVSATVPSNHSTVVKKDFRAIAAAVREVAAVQHSAVH